MFDFQGWIRRAETFTLNIPRLYKPGDSLEITVDIKPPLVPTDVKRLEKQLAGKLPTTLRDFLQTGSQHCDCHYSWRRTHQAKSDKTKKTKTLPKEIIEIYIYGGARFCEAFQMARLREFCQEVDWGEDTKEKAIWMNALPICDIGNGDMIALDIARSNDDPPVMYLEHGGDSGLIAASFTSFVTTWEQLCYVGPEHRFLDKYLGSDSHLSANSKAVQQLRDTFAIKENL